MTGDTSGSRKRVMAMVRPKPQMTPDETEALMSRLKREAAEERRAGRGSSRKGALWAKLKSLGLKPLTTQKTNSGRRYQRWCGEVDGDKREVVVMYENSGAIKTYVMFDHEAMIAGDADDVQPAGD